MHLRDTIIRFVCIILAAALLIVAGMRLDYINAQRQEMKLISNEPLENAPPSLAFATVAMGAFRGLVVDILWMRADKLKDEGQFFDAKQLAEWITILQPRFASVWEFHSWNMAYNISVAIPATQPAERWRWVKNGYELIRDKGIEINPKSIGLYRQLASIFQDKIGSVRDEAHKYYKLQLAMAMEPLIAPADKEHFKAIAEAPTSWEQIVSDANIVPLIEALKSADKAFEDGDVFVKNYLSLRQNPSRFKPEAFNVIDDFRVNGAETLKKFDIFAKAYQLRKNWKLNPVLMQELNNSYGPIDWKDPNTHLPLDWRHPDSHAIYWAVKGLQTTGEKEGFFVAEINTDRIVNHSLQNLYRYGTILVYDVPPREVSDMATPVQEKEVFLRPDLRMFETYDKSVRAVIEKYRPIAKKGSFESLQIGHRNMLENALLLFYQTGHTQQAQKIYNELRKLYPNDEFKVSLVAFARNRLQKEFEAIGPTDAKEMIHALLRESYFRYATRDDDAASGREKFAKEVHRHYQTAYSDENRIDLPDFMLLRYSALIDFFEDRQYPINLRRSLIARIRIEKPKLAEQFEQIEKKMLKELEQSRQPE
ncbi:MAG: hypothetical protein ACYS1A_04140 [Planctomycetota bacterium]|jgi:hypothetical protein